MEWSWRTVLILLGLLGIAVILVDGFRRMKRARAEALRLDIKPSSEIPDGDDFNPELPGTVRVVGSHSSGENDVFAPQTEKKPAVKPSLLERTSEQVDSSEESKGEHKTEQNPSKKKAKHSSTAVDKADTKAYNVSVKRKEPTLGGEATGSSSAHEETDETPLQSSLNSVEAVADEEPKGMFSDYAPDKTGTDKTTAKESKAETKAEITKEAEDIPNSPLIPTVKPVDLNEQVPVLLDVEELGDEASFEEGIVSAPRVAAKAKEDETIAQAALSNKHSANPEETGSDTDQANNVVSPASKAGRDIDDASFNSEPESAAAELPEVENPDTINDPHLEEEVEQIPEDALISQPVNYAGPNAEVLANRKDAEMVLVIHTIARDMDGFRGKDLLFLFNSCDLRYGEKDIFHRFEDADGEGCIQFSVAQMHNPGTFDPAQMADQNFSGLSFFMSLPGPKKPLEAYEAMSEMAQVVSRNLKADVLDGSHSAMTPQTMEHERQQILDYERQQRLAAKKQRL